MTIFWQLLLQIALIACNAFFACAEIAVISVSDARLAQLIEQGNKKALRLSRMTSDPAKFLATIQVAITLSGFLGSAFAADNFAGLITEALYREGGALSRNTLNTLSVVIVTLILSYITLVCGELVPKRLAMKNAEKLALSMSGTIHTLSVFFRPVVWLLSVSTNGVLRLFGVDPNATEETVYEEDIKDLVDQGNRKGVIDIDEREIIHNLFEFDDISVGELATHRTDLKVLYLEDDPDEWHRIIIEGRHSYYPVCSETVDVVEGVLCAKDYFALEDRNRENIMQSAVRPPYFVPEGVRADVLFKHMKKSKNHFAVVLDEYGGVTGIATMNDLLAQIVGDFDDDQSAPEEKPDIVKTGEDTWEIQGSTSLGDVCRALSMELPVDEYDTFGGYIMGLYGSVPEDGTVLSLTAGTLVIENCVVENHRVESAKVIKLVEQTEEQPGEKLSI